MLTSIWWRRAQLVDFSSGEKRCGSGSKKNPPSSSTYNLHAPAESVWEDDKKKLADWIIDYESAAVGRCEKDWLWFVFVSLSTCCAKIARGKFQQLRKKKSSFFLHAAIQYSGRRLLIPPDFLHHTYYYCSAHFTPVIQSVLAMHKMYSKNVNF